MKNHLFFTLLFIIVVFTSCEKEDTFSYDTYVGYVNYNENNEYLSHEKYYYKNNLIIKADFSSKYIISYAYDKRNNLIRSDEGNGSYLIYEYDSENRRIKEKQYSSDTLYLETRKLYKDTFLTKEIFFNKAGDSLSNTTYYYDTKNRLDSVIAKWEKIYHYYTSDSHKIIKLQNNLKHFESNTTFENSMISTYNESYFTASGEVFQSVEENRNYNENKSLLRLIVKQYFLTGNRTYYEDYKYLYNSNGKMSKSESYDADSKLLQYVDYIYDGDKLVKKQYFDSNGNKTLYTIVEYAYKK